MKISLIVRVDRVGLRENQNFLKRLILLLLSSKL
jgi:hypothetical protein